MSEETATVSGTTSVERFATGFRDIYYEVVPNIEDFDLQRFQSYFRVRPELITRSCVDVAPRDEQSGPYNIHFIWNTTPGKLRFRIEYYNGPRPHGHGEQEPYAEEFMSWFSQFFRVRSVQAHIRVRFTHPLTTRRSALPLPQTTSLPYSAELYGVSLRLKATPTGVTTLKLIRGRSQWSAEAFADRIVELEGFEPYGDVLSIASTLSAFLEQSGS